jgi:GDP-D-mannose 3',5'-epimerase
MSKRNVLVTGAGGFIGHHLVNRLKAEGCCVRGVDIKMPEFEPTAADEFELLDLRKYDNCLLATRGSIEQVYNLAADMAESATSRPLTPIFRATTSSSTLTCLRPAA